MSVYVGRDRDQGGVVSPCSSNLYSNILFPTFVIDIDPDSLRDMGNARKCQARAIPCLQSGSPKIDVLVGLWSQEQ